MYAEFLSMSFDVVTAPDGEKGFAQLRERQIDLIITDLSLPGMNGFELVSAVRKDARLRDTPIICLSGYGGLAYEQRAHEAGCDRILQKPFMPDALADLAAELIREAAERGPRS
jgi:chemosensory pili system protein ChpA (sensor histidine kinase/response regulator)